MASITKVGDKWRAQLYVKGIRDSGVFDAKADAKSWAVVREVELRTQAKSCLIAGKTCKAAFDRYAAEVSPTKRGERWERLRLSAMDKFMLDGRLFGEILLSEVTADMIGKWRDARLSPKDGSAPVKGSTVNRDLNLLSNVFAIAREEWGWMGNNPTAKVRRPKDPLPRDRRITEAEITLICHALDFDESPPTKRMQYVAVAFLFAIETGMRAGEICGIRSSWVDGAVVRIPMTKNGTRRNVPLSSRALELLALLGPECSFNLSTASLDANFRKGTKRAGVKGITFHDTRHEAVTRLSKKLGVLPLARMVGIKDLKMLNRYYNESAEDIAKMLD